MVPPFTEPCHPAPRPLNDELARKCGSTGKTIHAPVDSLRATYAEAIGEHGIADPIQERCLSDDTLFQDVKSRFICHQECARQVIRLGLDTTITGSFAGLCERRGAFVTQKAMRQLVADIAALSIEVMRVVMDDGGVQPARYRDGRKRGAAPSEKRGAVVKITQPDHTDIKSFTDSERVDRRRRVQAHLLSDADRDTVGFCLETASEPQFNYSEVCCMRL